MRREIFPENVPMYGLAQIVALGHHWVYANLQKPLLHVLTVAARQRYDGYEYDKINEICDLLGDLALVVRAWTQAAFWYEKALELASSKTVDPIRWDDLAFVFEQAGDFRKARRYRYQRMFDSKEKRDHRYDHRRPSRIGRKKRLSGMDRREGRWMSLLFRNSPHSVQRRIAHHTDQMGCAMKRRVYGVKAQCENFLRQMEHDLTTWRTTFDEFDFFFSPAEVLDRLEFWQSLQTNVSHAVVPDLGIWEDSDDWNESNTSTPIFYERRNQLIAKSQPIVSDAPMYRQISTAILPLHIARLNQDLPQIHAMTKQYPGWLTPVCCLEFHRIHGRFPSWHEVFTQRLPSMKE